MTPSNLKDSLTRLFLRPVYRQLLAAGLALCLALPVPLEAAPQAPLKTPVPEALAWVESFHAGPSGKTIFYIQDAHDSLDIQENIAALIAHLVRKEKVQSVFEEGYEGLVPTDRYFDSTLPADVRRAMAYYLLDQLRIGGAEYAHILRTNENPSENFKLIGADSFKLHFESIAWFQKTARQRREAAADLQVWEREFRHLAEKNLPDALLNYLKLKNRLEEDQIPLLDYLKRIRPMASPDFQGQWIDGLLSGQETGALQNIQPRVFFEEIESLEKAIASRHIRTRKQRRLFLFLKTVQLLERLIDFRLSPAEFETVSRFLEEQDTATMAQFLVRHTGVSAAYSRRWESAAADAQRFYHAAVMRETVLAQNLEDFLEMPSEKKAVLVYGGFHRQGIEETLKRLGFSFYVISPRMKSPKPSHHELYQQLMTKGYALNPFPETMRRASRLLSQFELAAARGDAGELELRAFHERLQDAVARSFERSSPAEFSQQWFSSRVQELLESRSMGRSEVRAKKKAEDGAAEEPAEDPVSYQKAYAIFLQWMQAVSAREKTSEQFTTRLRQNLLEQADRIDRVLNLNPDLKPIRDRYQSLAAGLAGADFEQSNEPFRQWMDRFVDAVNSPEFYSFLPSQGDLSTIPLHFLAAGLKTQNAAEKKKGGKKKRSEVRTENKIKVSEKLRERVLKTNPKLSDVTDWEGKLAAIAAAVHVSPKQILEFFTDFPRVITYTPDNLSRKWQLLIPLVPGNRTGERLAGLRGIISLNTDLLELLAAEARKQKRSLDGPNHLRRLYEALNRETRRKHRKTAAAFRKEEVLRRRSQSSNFESPIEALRPAAAKTEEASALSPLIEKVVRDHARSEMRSQAGINRHRQNELRAGNGFIQKILYDEEDEFENDMLQIKSMLQAIGGAFSGEGIVVRIAGHPDNALQWLNLKALENHRSELTGLLGLRIARVMESPSKYDNYRFAELFPGLPYDSPEARTLLAVGEHLALWDAFPGGKDRGTILRTYREPLLSQFHWDELDPYFLLRPRAGGHSEVRTLPVPDLRRAYIGQVERMRGWLTHLEERTVPDILSFGDKHGRPAELQRIYEKAREIVEIRGSLQVIGHGDAFDRGNGNLKTFELMKKLKKLETAGDDVRVWFLLGNHDVEMIRAVLLRQPGAMQRWLLLGGRKVIEEFSPESLKTETDRIEINKSLKEFALWVLFQSDFYRQDALGFLHVHAGVPAGPDGLPLFSRATLDRWQSELQSLREEIRNDFQKIQASKWRQALERLFKEAEPVYNTRPRDWVDVLSGPAKKTERLRYLSLLEAQGVIAGHTRQSQLLHEDYRFFLIDTDWKQKGKAGDPGWLAWDPFGLRYDARSRNVPDMVLSREKLKQKMAEEIQQLQAEIRKTYAPEDLIAFDQLSQLETGQRIHVYFQGRDHGFYEMRPGSRIGSDTGAATLKTRSPFGLGELTIYRETYGTETGWSIFPVRSEVRTGLNAAELSDDLKSELAELSVGERIRRIREYRGLHKQKDLAEKAGIGSSTYAYIEKRDAPPEPRRLKTIARVLEVDPIWILTGKPLEQLHSETLGRRIEILRFRLGLTQEELIPLLEAEGIIFAGSHAKAKRSTISQWEHGVVPSSDKWPALSKVLEYEALFDAVQLPAGYVSTLSPQEEKKRQLKTAPKPRQPRQAEAQGTFLPPVPRDPAPEAPDVEAAAQELSVLEQPAALPEPSRPAEPELASNYPDLLQALRIFIAENKFFDGILILKNDNTLFSPMGIGHFRDRGAVDTELLPTLKRTLAREVTGPYAWDIRTSADGARKFRIWGAVVQFKAEPQSMTLERVLEEVKLFMDMPDTQDVLKFSLDDKTVAAIKAKDASYEQIEETLRRYRRQERLQKKLSAEVKTQAGGGRILEIKSGRSEVRSSGGTNLLRLPEERLTAKDVSLILTHLADEAYGAPYDTSRAARSGAERLLGSGFFLPERSFEYVAPGHPSYLAPGLQRIQIHQTVNPVVQKMYGIENLQGRIFVLSGGAFGNGDMQHGLPVLSRREAQDCRYCLYQSYGSLIGQLHQQTDHLIEIHLPLDALYSVDAEFVGSGDGWFSRSRTPRWEDFKQGFITIFKEWPENAGLSYETLAVENGEASLLSFLGANPRIRHYLWDSLDPMLEYFSRRIARSEIRATAPQKPVNPAAWKQPAAVFIDANELARLSEDETKEQMEELLLLLSQNRSLDVYVSGESAEKIKNTLWQKLTEEYGRRIHIGPLNRPRLAQKKIFITVSLLQDQGSFKTAAEKLRHLKQVYGLKEEILPLEYTRGGALTGVLALAESLQAGELIRELGALYAVRTQNGYWRLAESYLASLWNEIQNAYVVQWSA